MRASTANRPVRISPLCKEEIEKINRTAYNGKLPFTKASEEFATNYRKMSEYIQQKGDLPRKKGGLL